MCSLNLKEIICLTKEFADRVIALPSARTFTSLGSAIYVKITNFRKEILFCKKILSTVLKAEKQFN